MCDVFGIDAVIIHFLLECGPCNSLTPLPAMFFNLPVRGRFRVTPNQRQQHQTCQAETKPSCTGTMPFASG